MKRLLFLLTLALPVLLSPLAGHSQEKWDLRRCVDYAVANNISVKQSDVQARLAKLTLDQSRLSQIPTLIGSLSGSVNAGHTQDPITYQLNTYTSYYSTPQLQSNVNVYNFSSLRNAIEANRLSWEAALAGSDKTKNDLTLNVANAYLQVLMAIEQTQASELQLHFSQSNLTLTRKQVNAGTLPELNAAELEAQVAQDSATYINSKGNIDLNILTLKAYMGMDAATPFDVATPPIEDIPVESIADLQPDIVYALALGSQPLQKMDSFQIAAARSNVASAKGARWPTFSVFGQLSSSFVKSTQYESKGYFQQFDDNFAQFLGVGINIPILNNGVLRTNYAKSKLNLLNNQLQRDQDNLTLKQNVYQAYTAAMTALQKFQANKISVAATQKSFLYAQKRYDVGMLNTIDLLTNQNNFFNARVNLLTSQFDYVFKMKVLEFYKGLGVKLTKE
ncbi:MAG TPA: TolC family protein [Puia sp.]|nr:TolC family protein [Puia sp.]